LPDISVILPVYNGGQYLKYAVESVLQQTHTDFEFLIINDCSTDNSGQYLKSLNDNRIQLFTNTSNKGLFWNLNYLISKCNSPLIKLWAQDDIMYPNCLSCFKNIHLTHPQIGFSYSKVRHIDESGNFYKPEKEDITPEIISSDLHALISFEYGCIAGNIANTCISRNALNKVGFFNENMRISADFEMWVRIAQFFQVGFINEPVIMLRDHKEQLSRNEKYYLNHVIEDLQVYRYLQSYVPVNIRKEGKKKLREKKLIFYYTLMLKTFFKGEFITGFKYLQLLNKQDNLLILSFRFFHKKIF